MSSPCCSIAESLLASDRDAIASLNAQLAAALAANNQALIEQLLVEITVTQAKMARTSTIIQYGNCD